MNPDKTSTKGRSRQSGKNDSRQLGVHFRQSDGRERESRQLVAVLHEISTVSRDGKSNVDS